MSYRPSITQKVELRYALAGAVSEAPCGHDEDVLSIRGVISQTDRVRESVQALLSIFPPFFHYQRSREHIYSYCASGQLLRVTAEAVSSH